ncbi:LacI family DNA-binding transcriptional regulator [Mucilaginibacter sp.]|jgi:LacI family transcriptional regulator|uniref:LacI family DNA-binding transcriptional regulator n=1 Tax=Mucilaginibacter sp. TaxID=1882438 RepID=UPI00356910C1
MKKKIGIKDIAEQLQVSKASVSVVLNGKARQYGISVALEEKILRLAKKVDYQPSRLAVGLSTGKSKTIGMLVEDISDPFFSSIARIVEKNAAAQGYRVIYGSTENDAVQTIGLLQTFRNHQVDGYIIAPSPGIDLHVSDLISDGFPVVVFDRSLPGIRCDKVLIDNFHGAFQAVSHLLANSFKNIVMITLLSKQDQMTERADGYAAAMKKYHLPEKVKAIGYEVEKSQCVQIIKKFLLANKNTDAFFFTTNYLALSGLQAIKELGLTISKNIGVIVFDDNTNFELFDPSISAVAQPIQEIGEQVTRIMLAILQGAPISEFETIILKTKLNLRSSSQNCRALKTDHRA